VYQDLKRHGQEWQRQSRAALLSAGRGRSPRSSSPMARRLIDEGEETRAGAAVLFGVGISTQGRALKSLDDLGGGLER
jgi:hypothetical protein